MWFTCINIYRCLIRLNISRSDVLGIQVFCDLIHVTNVFPVQPVAHRSYKWIITSEEDGGKKRLPKQEIVSQWCRFIMGKCGENVSLMWTTAFGYNTQLLWHCFRHHGQHSISTQMVKKKYLMRLHPRGFKFIVNVWESWEYCNQADMWLTHGAVIFQTNQTKWFIPQW